MKDQPDACGLKISPACTGSLADKQGIRVRRVCDEKRVVQSLFSGDAKQELAIFDRYVYQSGALQHVDDGLHVVIPTQVSAEAYIPVRMI